MNLLDGLSYWRKAVKWATVAGLLDGLEWPCLSDPDDSPAVQQLKQRYETMLNRVLALPSPSPNGQPPTGAPQLPGGERRGPGRPRRDDSQFREEAHQ